MKTIKRYGIISLGCIVFAISFALFLRPLGIAPGGVSGIAILISHFYPAIDSGVIILVLNIPLLIAGAVILGSKFLRGTFWATFFSSVCISALEKAVDTVPTNDVFCAAVVGALLMGVGLGLVFLENATTGGSDIAVKLIQRRFPHLKSGHIFLLIDSLIVVASGIVNRDIRTATYSGIALALSMLVLNYILYGGVRAKLLIIIDRMDSKLSSALLSETGVTVIDARGAYSGENKSVFICAVNKRKYHSVIRMIADTSPDALIITAPAEGFSHGRAVI